MAIGSSPARFIAGNDEFSFGSTSGHSEAGPDVTNVEVMVYSTVAAWMRITRDGKNAGKDGKLNQFVDAGVYLVFAVQPASIVSMIAADDEDGIARITWLT